jgi:tRNA/rRNA methyltransferase
MEPAVPENVGASARALKTMGFTELRMINPCEYLDGKAKYVAHGSYDILENAKVFTSLKDALTDIDFVIGTTARFRKVRADYYPGDKLTDLLESKKTIIKKAAIVFGREERGLDNDEVELCHITTSIPMADTYPSLNLSQAVMIYSYILSGIKKELLPMQSGSSANKNEVKAAEEKIRQLLDQTSVANRPALYNRIIERFHLLGEKDVHLVLSVANGLIENRKEE